MKPILKWTGGKYDEYKEFKDDIPSFNRYYEPFFGGGGIFFSLQPGGDCFCNDVSYDLIQFYKQIPNPLFQKELWKYVKAWEQSGALAKFIGKKLIAIVEQYVAGKVSDTRVGAEIMRVLRTISHEAYTPLFNTPFIINRKLYVQHLANSLEVKCTRLKLIATREHGLSREKVLRQIETAVQSGFYTHIRWLHNYYATEHKPHH